jgi:hypothetical protein
MSFQITATVECFLLPDDGAAAQALFLQHLKDPYEMWIVAYSFTLAPMIDEIIANNTATEPIHIYLDASQSAGKYEAPEIAKLVAGGVEVTIGTSPAGSQFICHTKGIVCDDKPEPWCWEGSTNFSASAWQQVNTVMFFHSQPYRDAFVNQFNHLRYFAWTQERDKQLMKTPPNGALTPPADARPSSSGGKKPTHKKTPQSKKTPAPAKTAKKSAASKKASPHKRAVEQSAKTPWTNT